MLSARGLWEVWYELRESVPTVRCITNVIWLIIHVPTKSTGPLAAAQSANRLLLCMAAFWAYGGAPGTHIMHLQDIFRPDTFVLRYSLTAYESHLSVVYDRTVTSCFYVDGLMWTERKQMFLVYCTTSSYPRVLLLISIGCEVGRLLCRQMVIMLIDHPAVLVYSAGSL